MDEQQQTPTQPQPQQAPPQPAPPEQPTRSFVTPPEERVWYLRPSVAIWLGPVLIAVCLVMRFGWNGIEGPPFPFWTLAYVAGAAGIYLTYTGWYERKS